MRKYSFFVCFISVIFVFVVNGNAEESIDFSFVVVSDFHAVGETDIERFKTFVKQLKELTPEPELVVITGDISAQNFEKAFRELNPVIPFHVIFGNIEKRNDRKILANMFPQDFAENDFYSFNYKNAKFIMLCTAPDNGDHIGHFESGGIKGEEQQAWLEEQLKEAKTNKLLSFVFSHIPPSPDGKAGKLFISSNDQKALRDLFHIYKPTAMFCGHLHRKWEFSIEHVPVFIVPSLSWNLESQTIGFYQVKVKGSELHTKFVPLEF
ncbi:MAG TPA: metallophosphoesterase [Candidatus Hydrogenedens sp.]|nr:metallophosphoesterase [Candidatus Hydrogenedens sp.]